MQARQHLSWASWLALVISVGRRRALIGRDAEVGPARCDAPHHTPRIWPSVCVLELPAGLGACGAAPGLVPWCVYRARRASWWRCPGAWHL